MSEVSELITQCGLTEREIAARSGISRATVARLKAGTTSPTVSTLNELAIALGKQLTITFTPAGSPDALLTARKIVGELETENFPNHQTWEDRLTRLASSYEDFELGVLLEAGKLGSAPHRPDALVLNHGYSVGALSSAGDWAGNSWAVSGAAGLNTSNRQVPGTNILYTSDIKKSHAALQNRASTAGRTILLPASKQILTGSINVAGIIFTSPLQIMLDCLGLEPRLAETAIEELKRWANE